MLILALKLLFMLAMSWAAFKWGYYTGRADSLDDLSDTISMNDDRED